MLALPFPNLPKVPRTLSFCFDVAKPHFRANNKRVRRKICVPGTLLEAEIGCQASCFWVQETVCCRGMRPTPSDTLIVQNGVSVEIEADLLAIRTKKSGRESEIPCRFCLLFRPPSQRAKGPHSLLQLFPSRRLVHLHLGHESFPVGPASNLPRAADRPCHHKGVRLSRLAPSTIATPYGAPHTNRNH